MLISTQNGWTPLMVASYEGHVDVARTLIQAKAPINTQKKKVCRLVTSEICNWWCYGHHKV